MMTFHILFQRFNAFIINYLHFVHFLLQYVALKIEYKISFLLIETSSRWKLACNHGQEWMICWYEAKILQLINRN